MTLSLREQELRRKRKLAHRVCVYLYPEQLKVVKQLDNFSAFVRLAINQAADLMAYDLLMKRNPEKYILTKKLEEVVDDFNKQYPTNNLTELRNKKCRKTSPPKPEIW